MIRTRFASSDTRIIELQPTEWKRYKKLRLRSLKEEPVAFAISWDEARKRSDKRWRAKLERARRKFLKILVAEKKKNLIGLLEIHFDDRKKRLHLAKLRNFYVAKHFRGQGIGQMLIHKALNFITKQRKGIKKIVLATNTPQRSAIALYKKSGFKIIGIAKKETREGGKFYDQYLMEKIL